MSPMSRSLPGDGLDSSSMSDLDHSRPSEQDTARSPTRAFVECNNTITRKARTSSRTVTWLSFGLLSTLCFCPHGVQSQRAIVAGLGTRIKKTFGGGGRSSSSNTKPTNSRSQPYTVQQGEEVGMLQNLLIDRLSLNSSQVCFTILAGVFGFIAAFLYHQHRQVTRYEKQLNFLDQDEGGDIVVYDDQILPYGGLEAVDLVFSDLYMEIKGKKNKSGTSSNGKRILLDGSIKGRARPGRMLAIMGPSGAGKSTVLHALAGKVKESNKVTRLEGLRYINGHQITGDSQVPAAFVEQEVTFFPHMTVRETIAFRVELKLGSLISKKAQLQKVEELIDELDLGKAADTIVGDAKVRGISGGERRRLSIACELISSPSVIFLDEPTSGLDSTAATNLVGALRKLADSGKTVVAVIHQPSQHVFAAFDDLLLLSEGMQMYFGEVSKVRQYMDSNVIVAPAEMGTAEHVLDCISKLQLPGESPDEADSRIKRLAALANEQDFPLGAAISAGNSVKRYGSETTTRRASGFVQFKLLLQRSLRENFRSKSTLIIKTVQQVSLGLIYGTIYQLGFNQASIQDRFGLLSLIAIGAANMAMASTVRAFPKEKAIVSNELAANMYGTLPYFVGKAISEIPLTAFFNSLFGILVSAMTGLNNTVDKLKRFLALNSLHGLSGQSAGLMIGAVAPSQDAALALFPAIMVLNIIFDGKNIVEENIPRLLRWLPKVGLIRWGFEAFCLNEFEGLTFETTGPQRGPVARNGVEALARFGLGNNSLGEVVKAQALIVSACWFLSYLGLSLTRQRFRKMEPPNIVGADGKE